MENICLEELNHLNEELRKNDGKSYDMSVRNIKKKRLEDVSADFSILRK